jgi:hypothetical protein
VKMPQYLGASVILGSIGARIKPRLKISMVDPKVDQILKQKLKSEVNVSIHEN